MASLIFNDGESDTTMPLPTSPPKLSRQLTGIEKDNDDTIVGNTEKDMVQNSSGDNIHNNNDKESSSNNVKSTEYKTSVGAPLQLKFNMGGIKDEGVKGKENQDDYFLWNKGDNKTYVIAVLDGHGRELGKLASKAAKDSLYRDLTSDKVLNQLLTTPKETMTETFQNANNAIREVGFFFFFFFFFDFH
jgi:hypothetical protein